MENSEVLQSKLNNSSELKQQSPSDLKIKLTNTNVLKSLDSRNNIARNKKTQLNMSQDTNNPKPEPGPQSPVVKKLTKQIRFDLDTSITPPPKEFKRLGSQRKTLRANRCMSTIVTEKEKALLFKKQLVRSTDNLSSPKPPPGIVQSMRRFYNDAISKGKLNRSSSFSSPVRKSDNASPESSSNDSTTSNESSNKKPSLFRSWSLRKQRKESQQGQAAEPQRCSPSYSTKSQDSGFSDAESNNNKQNFYVQSSIPVRKNQVGGVVDSKSEKQSKPREDFQKEIHQEKKMNRFSKEMSNQLDSNSRQDQPMLTPTAMNRVSTTLDNIASLQEGLKLKKQIFEEDRSELLGPNFRSKSHSNLLIKASPHEEEEKVDKARKQFYFSDVRRRQLQEDQSQMLNLSDPDLNTHDNVLFSTPVRDSFRRRPRTMIEGAKTPIKIDSKIGNLREAKRRPICEGVTHDLVHDWKEFLNYEATLPELSTMRSEQSFAGRETHDTQLSLNPFRAEGDATHLSHLSSLVVDGTETQLLLESFNNNPRLKAETASHFAMPKHDQSTLQHPIIELEDLYSSFGSASSNRTSSNNTSGGQSNVSLLNTSPVHEWCRDLHVWCEPECMTYLQSKPIMPFEGVMGNFSQQENQCISDQQQLFDSNQMIELIKRIQRGSRALNVTFTALNNHFSVMNLMQISKTLQIIMTQVQEFIFDYNLGLQSHKEEMSSKTEMIPHHHGWTFPGFKTRRKPMESYESRMDEKGVQEILMLQEKSVLQLVDRLKLCAHRCQYSPQQPLKEMRMILQSLETSFNKLTEMMLVKEMKSLLHELQKPVMEVPLRLALNTIILLGNEASSHLCALLAKEGGVRALLELCNKPESNKEVIILALRGISSICCVSECIREFEKCEGLRLIDSLMNTRQTSSLEVRVECAGVLAQITSPWISDNHKIHDLDQFVPSLVIALTGLSRLNIGEEAFLLVTAALANLTFMSSLTSVAMMQANTIKTLVKAVQASSFVTLFAKDQVVTVLANMAANANCRPDIRAIDGVGFLMTMLDTKIVGSKHGQAELAAAERVQKKAAIALSRLCNDTQVCYDVIRRRGVDRLAQLCKDPGERNYSDAVLVACLAVLRRLKTNVDNSQKEFSLVFEQLEAEDLIAPKLVDSFLEYSAKQESYV